MFKIPNLRSIFAQSIDDHQKHFINRQTADSYRDTYFGEVVDNTDPQNLGRIKVRVEGLYDDISTSDIPWALPTNSFIGSKTGSLIVPPLGIIVAVSFMSGDPHLPVYLPTRVHTKDTIPDAYSDKTLVFFETDDGDSFTIKQDEKELSINHSSGALFKIDRDGTVHIKASKMVDDSKLIATPSSTPMGHYCAIPVCPYSGTIHINSETIQMPILP